MKKRLIPRLPFRSQRPLLQEGPQDPGGPGDRPNSGGDRGGQRRPGQHDGPEQGPPDLDELWNDFNRKLGSLFGNSGRRRSGGGNHRMPGGGNFRPSGKGAGVALGILLAGVLAVWLASGIFIVREGERAAITTFGKYESLRGPGLHWRMPTPIQKAEIVRLTQIRSVDVGGDQVIKATGLRESAMLTEDENIVEVKFAVQYRLSDAPQYLYETKDPDRAVVHVAQSAVREVVGKMTMDTALAENRDQIAPRVRSQMQTILDRYATGIEVVAVNMQDGGVRPPEQVQAAFDDVLKAGQERERIKNEAQAYANDVIPRARGTASRMAEAAEGYKARVVAQAQGEADRFLQVLLEYEKAPRVTRDRLYIDTLKEVYSGVGKIVVDGKSGSNLLYLPLDKIIAQGSGNPGANRENSSSSGSSDGSVPRVDASIPDPVAVPVPGDRNPGRARSRISDFR